jgi:hypothetical protein
MMSTLALDPLIAVGVVLATALTDAAYVMFTSAVIAQARACGLVEPSGTCSRRSP